MKSPENMRIIQIDITNACTFNCSNCTRFCGQHKKPFFMDFETFKNAVDSLKDFKGVVGIIGGEPTLHPEFDKFIKYLAKVRPEYRTKTSIKYPVNSVKNYFNKLKYINGSRNGLFSSMGEGYYKHFELIQDIFPYQSLNDHRGVNTHQAILIPRKEIGIDDKEWIEKRDKCWVQNLWSATITPKGAFYCEIAGSMDMLFNGKGGWRVDSNWWKKTPEEFKDQIHWCENCSLALDVPSIPATEQTDLISPEMEKKLLEINGWKMREGKYKVFDPKTYTKKDKHKYNPIWYLQEQGDEGRVSADITSLTPKQVDIALLNGKSEHTTLTKQQLENLEFRDFVVVFNNKIDLELVERIKKCILNPGFYYDLGNVGIIFNKRAMALENIEKITIDKNLRKLWNKKKYSKISAKNIGNLNIFQKTKLSYIFVFNRINAVLTRIIYGMN